MSGKSEALRKRERMQIKISTLLDYYLTTKKVKGCSPKTIVAIRSVMERFIRFLEGREHSLKLVDLSIEDARAYVVSLQGKVTKYPGHKFNNPIPDSEYSPQTIHSHVRILRTFSNWVKDEGYSTKPIFERLELPRLPQVKIAVLSPEEIQQVLGSINPGTFIGARLIAMVLVMLDTGIRAGELVGMQLANVDWDRGVIKVFGKGSKERFVPIGATAKQTMLRYVQTFRPKPARDDIDQVFLSVDGYALTVNALVHIMHRLAKNSGVERLHAHLLRHTSGVTYLVNGGDTKSLQMYLGHTSAQMTNHYEQLTTEHMMAQHRKFSPVDSLGVSYRRFGKPKANGAKSTKSSDFSSAEGK
ncbi:MAG: tyrosine-type recombinase/integrase [Chloroflexi bacterium]|nr:tyrosine-type recombinase/integrase [Chloroflexota bacterium]